MFATLFPTLLNWRQKIEMREKYTILHFFFVFIFLGVAVHNYAIMMLSYCGVIMCVVRNAIEWIWLESRTFAWLYRTRRILIDFEKLEKSWVKWNKLNGFWDEMKLPTTTVRTEDTTRNVFDLELMKSLLCCSLFRKFKKGWVANNGSTLPTTGNPIYCNSQLVLPADGAVIYSHSLPHHTTCGEYE